MTMAWRSNAALAASRLGDADAARALAAEELDLARSLGAPRALGVALRAHGVVHGGEPGLASLRDAVDVLRSSDSQLERARALCELGAALRRANRRRDAREPLREALAIADA